MGLDEVKSPIRCCQPSLLVDCGSSNGICLQRTSPFMAPSRHLARAHQSGRFQIKADINGRQEALTNGKVAGGTKNPVLRTSGNSAESLARPLARATSRVCVV